MIDTTDQDYTISAIVPLSAVPSQTLTTLLAPPGVQQQRTTLDIYVTNYGLYMDVYLNDALVIGGVICENANRIIRSTYLGYAGDFAFFDTQPDPVNGPSDPTYDGLGTRYLLGYLT